MLKEKFRMLIVVGMCHYLAMAIGWQLGLFKIVLQVIVTELSVFFTMMPCRMTGCQWAWMRMTSQKMGEVFRLWHSPLMELE